MPHRDRAKPLEARLAKLIPLPPQHAGGGGTGQRSHRLIDFGQQCHVNTGVALRKRMRRGAVLLDQPFACHPARYQPRDLGAAVAAHALQVGQHHPALCAFAAAVVKPLEHLLDPGVPPCLVCHRTHLQRLRPCQYFAHLIERAHLCFVHVDHHSVMINPPRRPCLSAALLPSYLLSRLISPWNPGTSSRLIPRWTRLLIDRAGPITL